MLEEGGYGHGWLGGHRIGVGSAASTRATAAIVLRMSAWLVRQFTTLIRIARRPRNVVPLKNAVPSALMAAILPSVFRSCSASSSLFGGESEPAPD